MPSVANIKRKNRPSNRLALKDIVLVYTNLGRTLGGQGLGQDNVGTHCPVTGSISSYELWQSFSDLLLIVGDFLIQSHTTHPSTHAVTDG